MSRALVTGATGLVGSHIVERLLADGWDVRALVRSSSADPQTEIFDVRFESPDRLLTVAEKIQVRDWRTGKVERELPSRPQSREMALQLSGD